jgi:acyl-coenzyme A thioesterase PaaI-like protein
MNNDSLSHTHLPGNDCFGCGPMNPHGLNITVRLDPENAGRITGEFNPQNHMIGFPGITHGGVIYTALDCMASWSGMVLRKTKAIWILRSASMKYHRPAFQGRPLALSAVIASQSDDPWQAIEVQTEARDAENNLLAEGGFKSIPLPPEKFMALTRIAAMPKNWQNWLNDR